MKIACKLFIPAFFFIFFLILPQPVLAQNATTLVLSAPSSVEKNENFLITAYYTSNGTNVCGAACKLEGGWLTSTVYLSEGSGCIYENTAVSAYGSVGSYSPYVNCYKQYYDPQTKYFSIDITQKPSSLSVSVSPPSPYPGDSVAVYAYYRDEGNSLIPGASCTADLKMGGAEFQKTTLASSGNAYYSGSFKVPGQYGTYDIEVACASSEYAAASSAKSFTTAKKRASFSVTTPPSAYYGESVKVAAYYKDMQDGKKIQGTCRVYFDDKTSVLSPTDSGYEGVVGMPYKAGAQSIKVTCESGEYETFETSRAISANNRQSGIEVISPYAKAIFYPTDEIQLRISYNDLLSNQAIAGAGCVAEAGGRSYPLAGSGKYYEGRLSNQSIGQQTIGFRCSKTFYESVGGSIVISVNRIPINIILTSAQKEFRKGEEIKILAMVVDQYNKDANAACKTRADVYDLSFNKLVESRDIEDTRTSDGSRVLNVPNPDSPSRIRVTMTCSGDIFEEKSVYTELKIKMLGTQSEEGITLFLAITTISLVVLTFLIRKKLKII
jgi:hypothetical protein